MDESTLSEDVSQDRTIVSVAGEVDVATAPGLRDLLELAVDRGTPALVVDLLGVTFIDSTALGVLIGVNKLCEDRSTSLHLVVADARIRKVFEITGLTDLFAIVPTVAEATGR